MEENPEETNKQKRLKKELPGDLSAILEDGYRNGRPALSAAITQVQKLTGMSREAIWKRLSRDGLARKSRRWAKADEECACELSTEKPAGIIARFLRRTPHSIECKLSRLKRTTRCYEGYTRVGLAEQLHLSQAAIRRFLDEQWLKLISDRLPNPDREDLKLDPSTISLPIPKPERDHRLRYGRISEQSLRQLLSKHAEEIPYWRLDPDTLEWLAELDFKPIDNPRLHQLIKHVERMHQCRWCGRKTAGNGHFRHERHCPRNPENDPGDRRARRI